MILSQKNLKLILCGFTFIFSISANSQPLTPITPKEKTPSLEKSDATAMEIAQKVMSNYQKIQLLQAEFFQILAGYGEQTGQRTRRSWGQLFSKRLEKASPIRINYAKLKKLINSLKPEDWKKIFLVDQKNTLKMYEYEDNQGCEKDVSKDSEVEAIRQLLQGTVQLTKYFQVKQENLSSLSNYLGKKQKLIDEEITFDKAEPGDQVLKLMPLLTEKNPYAAYQHILLVTNSKFLIKKVILLNVEGVVNWYSLRNIKLNQDATGATDAMFQFSFPADAKIECP